MKTVVLIFRNPVTGGRSIEFLFDQIFLELDKQVDIGRFVLPFQNKGLLGRIRNALVLLRFRNKIVHLTGDSYYALLGAWFCKRIVTVHDLSFLDRTTGWKHFVLKWFWVIIPVRVSHKITVVSEATRQRLSAVAGIPACDIQVIPNFIDPIFKPVQRHFCQQKPRILQVGTAFNKNLERVAAALRTISCVYVIIGKLSQAQINLLQDNAIEFEQHTDLSQEALFQQYARADLLAFVSTVEGFGLPILEAQACGLPVITSNCSSMPEVAGKGAHLVDPFSAASISAGIRQLIADPLYRDQLVAEGYANSKRFSKQQVALAYQALYSRLMNNNP